MCDCVHCKTCNGTGYIWKCFDGSVGTGRLDDSDEMVTCPDCNGTGWEDICDECAAMMEMEE